MTPEDTIKWSECRQKHGEDQSLSPGPLQVLKSREMRGNKQRRLKKESQGSEEKLVQCGVWKPSEESVPKEEEVIISVKRSRRV